MEKIALILLQRQQNNLKSRDTLYLWEVCGDQQKEIPILVKGNEMLRQET